MASYLLGDNMIFACELAKVKRDKCLNALDWRYAVYVCVLTTGTTDETAVMVEAAHSLAGLVGSIHCLITLNTDSCNTTQNITSQKSNSRHTHHLYNY